MIALIEPWGAVFAVRDATDGTLVRRGFYTRDEADDWSTATDRCDLAEFFYPSPIHFGEDWDERRQMKRVFATSAQEALDWATYRHGASLTIDNIFGSDGAAAR